MDISKYIDHTILKAEATPYDIERICNEALKYEFYAVCVNPAYVELAASILQGRVKVATVLGFPLGASSAHIKAEEAKTAIDDGADELDMVMNIGMMKCGDYEYVRDEIKLVKSVCKEHVLKVIVETCLLSKEEKESALRACLEGGADFIKTSTGFSTGGADVNDIMLFRELAEGRIKIKASGGIRDREAALKMIEAGADRLGTSASVKIVEA